MSRTIEQDRAKYALQQVTGFDGDKTEYSTLIKKLPAMILNNGLGQALAFLLAKNEGNTGKDEKPSRTLYAQLQKWLLDMKVYSDGDLLKLLMNGDREQYMHAQHETLKLLTWMKKFAEAYLPKTGGG
jgi:CRISPR-associated protein Cmr5